MFFGLDVLEYVELNDLSLMCFCDNVWFVKYFVDYNIIFGEGVVCFLSINGKKW